MTIAGRTRVRYADAVCPTCRGAGVSELTPGDCQACSGTGSDWLIPETELRTWIIQEGDRLPGCDDRLRPGVADVLVRLSGWLEERHAMTTHQDAGNANVAQVPVTAPQVRQTGTRPHRHGETDRHYI